MFTEEEILEFLNSFSGINKKENTNNFIEDRQLVAHLRHKNNNLIREIYTKDNECNTLKDKIIKLEQKVENLKEDRKHLLQDKNAVINLTKGLLNDIVGCDTWGANLLIVKYLEELNNLNLGSNDSNTRTYIKLKQERDKNKEIANQLLKQNQNLVNEINELKDEIVCLKNRLIYKAIRFQTKGK